MAAAVPHADDPPESHAVPSVLRTGLAAAFNPLLPHALRFDFHTSNLQPELQAESFKLSQETPFAVCAAALRKMRNGGASKEALRFAQEQILDQHQAVHPVTRDVTFTLISNSRGNAGETLLHLAALYKLYDLVLWLIAVEPQLAREVYAKTMYNEETVLHLLVAQDDIVQLRRFAKALLHYDPAPPAGADNGAGSGRSVGGAGAQAATPNPAADLIRLRGAERSEWWWGTLPPPERDRRAWMRDAWLFLVHHEATGSFFELEDLGGKCYIAGTPVGLAVKMGSSPIVRFLVVEVGCLCKGCWDELAPGALCFSSGWGLGEAFDADTKASIVAANAHIDDVPAAQWDRSAVTITQAQMDATRLKWLYPGNAASDTPFPEELVAWDRNVCAVLDTRDVIGNTPAHVAVMAHPDCTCVAYISSLYSKGFGHVRKLSINVNGMQQRDPGDAQRSAILEHFGDGTKEPSRSGELVSPLSCVMVKADWAVFPPSQILSELLGRQIVWELPDYDEARLREAQQHYGWHDEQRAEELDRLIKAPPAPGDALAVVISAGASGDTFVLDLWHNIALEDHIRKRLAWRLSFLTATRSNRENIAAEKLFLELRGCPTVHHSFGLHGAVSAPPQQLQVICVDLSAADTSEASAGGAAPVFAPAPAPPAPQQLFCSGVCSCYLAGDAAAGGRAAGDAAAGGRAPVDVMLSDIQSKVREALSTSRRSLVSRIKLEAASRPPEEHRERISPFLLAQIATAAVTLRRRAAHAALEEMYGRLEDTGHHRSLLDALNVEGLTPLTLAVQLGRRELFQDLLKVKSKQIWTFGNTQGISAHIYALDGLDDTGECMDLVAGAVPQLQLPVAPAPPRLSLASKETLWRKQTFLRRGLPPVHHEHRDTGAPEAQAAAPAPQRRPSLALDLLYWLLEVLIWWLPLPWALLWEPFSSFRQLTAEDVLVRYDQWAMLEPEPDSAHAEQQFRQGAATLAALGVWHHDSADELKERQFSTHLQEANHWFHVHAMPAEASLDGSRYVNKDKSTVLEQLSERKWERLYAPRFMRLAFSRLAAVVLSWVFLFFRMSAPTPANVSMTDVAEGASGMSRREVLLFAGFIGAIFAVHLLRYLVLGLPPLLKATFCVPKRHPVWPALHSLCNGFQCCSRAPEPFKPYFCCETRLSRVYTSGHSGRTGIFHLLTLLLGSGLLLAASLIDLYRGGLAAAQWLYSSGSFFFSLHLLYFGLGWEYTGPLLVMIFSVLTTELVRWVFLFIPVILIFSWPLFLSAAYVEPSLFANATTANVGNTLARSMAVVLDQAFNPYATLDVPHREGGSATTFTGNVLSVMGWVVLVFIISIVLMSLLVAMFTRTFEQHSERAADFLIERVRIMQMLESTLTHFQRIHVHPQDRPWLENVPMDVRQSGDRMEPHPAGVPLGVVDQLHRGRLAPRPYLFNHQAVVIDTPASYLNKSLTKRALNRTKVPTLTHISSRMRGGGSGHGSSSGGAGGH